MEQAEGWELIKESSLGKGDRDWEREINFIYIYIYVCVCVSPPVPKGSLPPLSSPPFSKAGGLPDS